MKIRSEVTETKLRGGYYTPEQLVAFCWRRIGNLATGGALDILEPAAGDGQFFRFLDAAIRTRIASVTAIEIEPSEAAKCDAAVSRLDIASSVVASSFLQWALDQDREFDAAIGNPPFLRFQFVSDSDRAAATLLGLKLRLQFEGVSNLWIPLLLGALAKLREGGVFSFVVPAELFTGLSAGVVRRWLLETTESLTVDLFPAGSFSGVLQEVVLLSGRRVADGSGRRRVEIVSHRGGASERWSHDAPASTAAWTRLLLTPGQLAAYDEAARLPAVRSLGTVARIQVSIVTGANDYFCVDDRTRDSYKLSRWCLPLLARARLSPGLVWRASDHKNLGTATKRWLIHFDANTPSPERVASPSSYLELGRKRGIPKRYKCRVRDPWFTVPDVWAGTLLLSKRSHRMPRLMLNAAASYTTDTIYRGRMLPAYRGRERDLVAAFHNSLTLLASELEGRSFGGGVHELVPSEIARLQVPLVPALKGHLDQLDKLIRAAPINGEADLVSATDELLMRADVGLSRELVSILSDARHALMWRRLERTSSGDADAAEEIDLLAV